MNQNPGCLAAILRLLTGGSQAGDTQTTGPLPYRVRDDFLSPAEHSFYHVLLTAVGARAVICPKVALADIFFVSRPNENLSYLNRIRQKHVDFLLCAPDTMAPLVGVELDDASHARAERQLRDAFVDQVFQAAQLPLLRIAPQRGYQVQELASQVAPYLNTAEPSHQTVSPTPQAAFIGATRSETSAPVCLKCGVPMVVRTATRGERQGEQFYGCPNYPRCRETRPLPPT